MPAGKGERIRTVKFWCKTLEVVLRVAAFASRKEVVVGGSACEAAASLPVERGGLPR